MSQPMQFNRDIITAVRKGEPINAFGLTLYPITMKDYDEYVLCKDAFAIMHGSLPAGYLSYDFLNALFVMAMDERASGNAEQNDNKFIAAFQRTLRVFYLALRVSEEEIRQIANGITYKPLNEDVVGIDKIVVHQNGKETEITPSLFSARIRPLIAYQNGIDLPDENANPELIRLYNKIHEHDNTIRFKSDIDDLIASVAYLSGVQPKDIVDWTIREFEYRIKAIERDKRYTLCGQAEMSGFASFKNGNPAPSWCYDVEGDYLGSSSLSELGKKLGGVGAKEQTK